MTEETRKRTRTCIGCGRQDDKAALHRIVRTADGSARLDASGRQPGRGAYVCSAGCFTRASQGKLQRALRCAVSKEDLSRIAEDLDKALVGALAR